MDFPEFRSFNKIPRLSREIVITEKLDGTNAQITITQEGDIYVGSRNRWITPIDDNFGFAKWVSENEENLLNLGVGTHFGEWWGQGIGRKYNLETKRFSLFNVDRWNEATKPDCCSVVPVLHRGPFDTFNIDETLNLLREFGSVAAPSFMKPEGIIIYHTAANQYFKKTLEKDDTPKTLDK